MMASSKRLWIVALVCITSLLTGCGQVAPVPPATATTAPSLTPITPLITPTSIPLPTYTLAPTPEPGTPTSCKIVNEDGKLYVLSDDVFFVFGPSEEELEQALAVNYPEWADYEQNVSWSSEPVRLAKIVREASFQEKFALNSTVTLVTLGESRDWQLPSDGDLFLESLIIGERLHHLWFEWTSPENEEIRAQFPEITNASTYALYVFFDYDTNRLQAWCNTYQRLFETSP